MGTRSAIGFRIDGTDKLVYNHSDSYPDGLGADLIDQLGEMLKNPTLKEQARALVAIPEDYTPTPEDVERCKPYTNLGVSTRSLSDWYCLTREAQGDLNALLVIGKFSPYDEFLISSLFCEFAYIINLDENLLEFYVGFNKDPKAAGRYASKTNDNDREEGERYYGVRLAKTWPLDAIPPDVITQMNEAADGEEEEDGDDDE